MRLVWNKKKLHAFAICKRGESSVQVATFFGALAVLVALVSAPLLDKTSREFASSRGYGVDHVVTGSVRKPKRYTVRKSVLDQQYGQFSR